MDLSSLAGFLPLILLLPIVGFCAYMFYTFRGSFADLRVIKRAERDSEALLAHGVRASAVVRELKPTGWLVSDDPVALLVLEVRPEEGEAFTAVVQATVPQLLIPQVQPGSTVTVAYDPSDQERVTVVFD